MMNVFSLPILISLTLQKKKSAMKDFYVFCLQRITFFHYFAYLLVSITIRIVVVFSVVAYQKNTVKNK